jgi:uncharacterized Zn finger protein (UPF0148 family)
MGYKYWCSSKNYRENPPEGGPTKFCSLTCEHCDKDGELLFEEKDSYVCPNTELELKLYGKTVLGIIGPKMTTDEIVKDRKERSHQDFRKNIFPTLDTTSKRHHIAKDPSLKKLVQ